MEAFLLGWQYCRQWWGGIVLSLFCFTYLRSFLQLLVRCSEVQLTSLKPTTRYFRMNSNEGRNYIYFSNRNFKLYKFSSSFFLKTLFLCLLTIKFVYKETQNNELSKYAIELFSGIFFSLHVLDFVLGLNVSHIIHVMKRTDSSTMNTFSIWAIN